MFWLKEQAGSTDLVIITTMFTNPNIGSWITNYSINVSDFESHPEAYAGPIQENVIVKQLNLIS